jgi:predicted ATPase/DNA-binding winged helix-turn-helix (wHTH) protein
VFESGDWEIDLSRRELRVRNAPVPLGSRAFEIIEVLLRSAGKLVTKDELMDRVWPGAPVGENTLHVHISAVRKALGPDRGMLRTASGRGYRLVGDWTIRQEPRSDGIDAEPVTASPAPFRTNLPAATSDLIGRTATIQHLRDLLSAYRTVTLTGPGGIGKSALALEVARSLSPTFQGDVWLVELVSLADPALVPSAVADGLGLKFGGDEISPKSIARAMGDKSVLLVLDNCEHVVEAVAGLVETIVGACPRASILATSREALRIDGECVFRVPALDVPPRHQTKSDQVLGHSAVQLFVVRTRALESDFSPHAESLPAIAAICRRLDGIPLAIEFAAARAATLGPQQVASRLDDRFRLLTGGRRTALPRHQTLRAALDWSYELLSAPEQRLLRHLSVFPAGFTLEAATAVVGDTDDDDAVVEGIANLVAKSLVTLDGSASAGRWRLLETIRAYAFEKLAEAGEEAQAARRHAEFFRNLFAPSASGWLPQPNTEGLASARREIDNIRAALDWSFSAAGDPAIAVALTAAYAPVWIHMALMVECRERSERALQSLEPNLKMSAPLQMQLYANLGVTQLYTMAPVERTRIVMAKALEVAESLDDDALLRTLWVLGALQFNIGECSVAQSLAERFWHIAANMRDPAAVFAANQLMGQSLHLIGDQREARSCFERVLELYAMSNVKREAIWFHSDLRVLARAMLARALWLQGFLDQASDHARLVLQEALAADQKLSLWWALRFAVCPIALFAGDIVAAEQAVAMLRDLAAEQNAMFWTVMGRCLEGKLMIQRGDFATGSAQLRAALKIGEQTGWVIWHPDLLGTLAEALAGLGRHTEALATVEKALACVDRDGERWNVAELLRIKGELLLQDAGNQSITAAEDFFHEAIKVARQQSALFWELRGAMSLARMRVGQGRPNDARVFLAPVYDKFTEGFETADLRAAQALLQSL